MISTLDFEVSLKSSEKNCILVFPKAHISPSPLKSMDVCTLDVWQVLLVLVNLAAVDGEGQSFE